MVLGLQASNSEIDVDEIIQVFQYLKGTSLFKLERPNWRKIIKTNMESILCNNKKLNQLGKLQKSNKWLETLTWI